MILIIILYIICASTFTFSKWGLIYSNPFFFASIRMILSSMMLLFYSFIKGYIKISNIKIYYIKDIIKLSIFQIYLTYATDAWSLKKISSIESSYIYNLSPFITALLCYILFNNRINKKQLLGISIAFLALTIGSAKNYNCKLFYNAIDAKLITILSVIFSAYGWIIMQSIIKYYNPILLNGMSMLIGGILLLITSLIFEDPAKNITNYEIFTKAMVGIILFSNILFYNLYGYLLKKYSATLLSFFGFLCPIFTSIFGEIFLSEKVCLKLKISFIFIVISLFIFYYEEIKIKNIYFNKNRNN